MNQINNMEKYILDKWHKLTQAQKTAFFGVLILGFISHGYVMFNRLSYHDNSASLFSLGATYELGRWGLGIIYDLQLLSTKTFSVPVFNVILSVLLIGVAAMVMAQIFNIKNKLVGFLIGALMVVYPVVTSIFSFMFTSWPYFLGLLLAVLSGKVFTEKLSIKNLIIGALLLACSLGMYQAFLGVTVTIVLFKLFVNVIEEKIDSVAAYAKNGFYYLAGLGLGLGFWELFAVAFRKIKGIEVMVYKGMDEGYSLSKFPGRLAIALKEFFNFRVEGINNLRYLRLITMLVFVLGCILMLVLLWKSAAKMSVKVSALVGIILLPVGMNVIYLLSTSDSFIVDSLMLYADLFIVLIPIILLERYAFEGKVTNIASNVLVLCGCVLTLGYTYLNNAAYLKADLYLEEAVSYWTAVMANIKSTEGFSDDMEIVFVGIENMDDGTVSEVATQEELDGVKLEKYYVSLDAMLRYAGNLEFMREHVGFGNEKVSVDDGTVASDSRVEAMPTYPNDGSIAIVDDRVVVKMGDNENEN